MTQSKRTIWILGAFTGICAASILLSSIALLRSHEVNPHRLTLTDAELATLRRLVESSIRIQDDEGGEPLLNLYDTDGNVRFALDVNGLCFYNKSGAPVLRATASSAYVGILMRIPTDDATGSGSVISLGVDEYGDASMEFAPGGGFASLSASAQGESEVLVGSGGDGQRAQVRLQASNTKVGIRVTDTATDLDWRAPR